MVKYKLTYIISEIIKRQGVALLKDGEIKAVHDKDLNNLLKSLDVYDDFIEGRVKCAFCNENINEDNLEAVFPLDNEVSFCCNTYNCYKQLLLSKNGG